MTICRMSKFTVISVVLALIGVTNVLCTTTWNARANFGRPLAYGFGFQPAFQGVIQPGLQQGLQLYLGPYGYSLGNAGTSGWPAGVLPYLNGRI
ncbi:hypothetical protein ACJMK2_041882 [Sinanodonta woodiana]|uniref:Uncharacterized protein n=1 Tax=Sinanodonta woodiana TaxID=1069815 RepID=A0ABD3W6Z1_SINWO